MQLLQLTPDEIAFLSAPTAAPNGLPQRLTRKLSATLTARLHVPVCLTLQSAVSSSGERVAPDWQLDAALSTLWLTRRLGGHQVRGASTFVPRTLIQTLDAALAECWLDEAMTTGLSPALAWQLKADTTQATLAVQLPQQIIDMTRWARGVIRHG